MSREKEGFREQLERLDETFPGREVLKLEECCRYLGLYRRTLLGDKTFPARKTGEIRNSMSGTYIVPKVALARWLA